MPAPPCQFTMDGGPTTLPKKDDRASWRMNPPNAYPCTVGATADGDLEVIQVGSDGSVTVKATSDNATGTVHVTKHCGDECGPTTIDIHIGAPVKPSWTAKVWFRFWMAWISMGLGIAGLVIGAIWGGIPGTLIGWFGGIGIGMFIVWLVETILDP